MPSTIPQELPAQILKLHFNSTGHSLEVISIHLNFGEAHPGIVKCDRCGVHIVIGQVSDVGQGDARVVHSNTALTISSRVKQSRLYIQMRLVLDQLAALGSDLARVLPLDLIAVNSVFVDLRAQDQVSCLLFDQDITVSANLVEAGRCTNPKHRFPSILPCQNGVQLICEFHCMLVNIKLIIVVE